MYKWNQITFSVHPFVSEAYHKFDSVNPMNVTEDALNRRSERLNNKYAYHAQQEIDHNNSWLSRKYHGVMATHYDNKLIDGRGHAKYLRKIARKHGI